jgi:hypothetical protein
VFLALTLANFLIYHQASLISIQIIAKAILQASRFWKPFS